MVLGYICQEHGYQGECDVSEGGERLCYECGEWVRGLVGRTRNTTASPPEGEAQAAGNIKWHATGHGVSVYVNAFDLRDAITSAIEKVDDPQDITEIKPRVRRYRN